MARYFINKLPIKKIRGKLKVTKVSKPNNESTSKTERKLTTNQKN